MFKVIKEQVKQPIFWLVCDHHNCAVAVTGPVDMTDKNKRRASQMAFIQSAQRQGWLIGLDAQLCPAHHRVQKAAVEQLGNMVQIAGSVAGVGKLTGEAA